MTDVTFRGLRRCARDRILKLADVTLTVVRARPRPGGDRCRTKPARTTLPGRPGGRRRLSFSADLCHCGSNSAPGSVRTSCPLAASAVPHVGERYDSISCDRNILDRNMCHRSMRVACVRRSSPVLEIVCTASLETLTPEHAPFVPCTYCRQSIPAIATWRRWSVLPGKAVA